ncbi:hypothetical protein MP228_007617 [Amoeboaphelidium protococcarum]|nr:hypothetical protein MP228_007617 [Amoeboaphelidium protococcarum]
MDYFNQNIPLPPPLPGTINDSSQRGKSYDGHQQQMSQVVMKKRPALPAEFQSDTKYQSSINASDKIHSMPSFEDFAQISASRTQSTGSQLPPTLRRITPQGYAEGQALNIDKAFAYPPIAKSSLTRKSQPVPQRQSWSSYQIRQSVASDVDGYLMPRGNGGNGAESDLTRTPSTSGGWRSGYGGDKPQRVSVFPTQSTLSLAAVDKSGRSSLSLKPGQSSPQTYLGSQKSMISVPDLLSQSQQPSNSSLIQKRPSVPLSVPQIQVADQSSKDRDQQRQEHQSQKVKIAARLPATNVEDLLQSRRQSMNKLERPSLSNGSSKVECDLADILDGRKALNLESSQQQPTLNTFNSNDTKQTQNSTKRFDYEILGCVGKNEFGFVLKALRYEKTAKKRRGRGKEVFIKMISCDSEAYKMISKYVNPSNTELALMKSGQAKHLPEYIEHYWNEEYLTIITKTHGIKKSGDDKSVFSLFTGDKYHEVQWIYYFNQAG